MASTIHSEFDQSVLDLIDHSPTGVVPRTPTYDDALSRLRSSQQVFKSSDFKDGHVTARALAKQPLFHAQNLDALLKGSIEVEALEPNGGIFDRYLHSLPAGLQARAATFREAVSGRPIHHRTKAGVMLTRDPLNTIFLIPGAGLQPGLPGNYLYGGITEHHDEKHPQPWCVHVHDTSNDAALFDSSTLTEALEKVQELLASVPFHMNELEALGFRIE